ncbi:MAG: lipopolysaccharide biosynthesis protein [Candidatus Omnitrophota bacterium]
MGQMDILDETIPELEKIAPPEIETGDLRKKTLSGMKWVFASSFGQRAISFVTTVILARLLSPADFGLFALAFVMIDGFGLFKSLGFDSALLRRKTEVEEAADTAFFLIPVFGFVLFILLFLLAPYGASFLSNPQVTPVVRALSFIFVLSCLAQVPAILVQKQLHFWKKAVPELASSVVYSVAAVVFAVLGFGVWSLVYAYLIKTFLYMVMIWRFAAWRPRFRFHAGIAKEMFHFGKFVFLGSLLVFLRNNLDNILIGKFLGVSALGFYAIAFNLATFLSHYVAGRMHAVLFPVFSRIQEDTEMLKRAFLKSFKMISLMAIPFGLFLFAAAPTFLSVVYGERWLPAGSVLRILACAGILKALIGPMGPVFLAQGRSRIDFWVSAVQTGVFFLLVVPAALFLGLSGVGGAVLVSAAASFAIATARVRKAIRLSPREILLALKPTCIGSCLMLFVFGSLARGRMLLAHVPAPVSTAEFIVILGLSGLSYLFSVFFLDRDVRLELRRFI